MFIILCDFNLFLIAYKQHNIKIPSTVIYNWWLKKSEVKIIITQMYNNIMIYTDNTLIGM